MRIKPTRNDLKKLALSEVIYTKYSELLDTEYAFRVREDGALIVYPKTVNISHPNSSPRTTNNYVLKFKNGARLAHHRNVKLMKKRTQDGVQMMVNVTSSRRYFAGNTQSASDEVTEEVFLNEHDVRMLRRIKEVQTANFKKLKTLKDTNGTN